MIRKMLEKNGLKLTDKEFNEVMQETENDIRKNHMNLGVRTSRNYLLRVAIIYYGISKSI